MQHEIINSFLKEQFGDEWELIDNVCHIDNKGKYFGTLFYEDRLLRMSFIYEKNNKVISNDMAMSLLMLNAHPEMIGKGAFSVTDNQAILLTFYIESEHFTSSQLKEFWPRCLHMREGYFNFLNDSCME